MGSRFSTVVGGALLMVLLAPGGARASRGYFALGVGTKQKGLGGAGVALPIGPSGGATNPATTALACRGYEGALALFVPNVAHTVTGGPSRAPGTFGLVPGRVEHDRAVVPVPQAAAGWAAGNGCLSVALYGNGWETDFDARTFFGTAPTGLSLRQIFIAPTYARSAGNRHAFGVSPILAYQRVRAEGLEALGPLSSAPDALTNNGHDSSLGGGVRVGYYGRLSDHVAIGAAYQSPIFMSRLDRYAGLFVDGGDLDAPATLVGGVALMPTNALTVVVDVQHTRFSDVDALGNPLLPNLRDHLFGDEDGPGFGWKSTTAVKAGLQWQQGAGWTWRGGYAFGQQPIPGSEAFLNILAPAVVEHHATFGLTRALGRGRDVSVALMRAFSNRVSGTNPFEAVGRQQIDLHMDQWELEVGFGVGF